MTVLKVFFNTPFGACERRSEGDLRPDPRRRDQGVSLAFDDLYEPPDATDG